ncbi:hypothetical protein [Pseudomonas profundi]|uniref:hypothetical protein n=1 Tax=Pseudomonas profundi TaxID=1981513 RepID=UPI001238C4B1|nr:hypothetical protein [Pseudomonas profundi]
MSWLTGAETCRLACGGAGKPLPPPAYQFPIPLKANALQLWHAICFVTLSYENGGNLPGWEIMNSERKSSEKE